MELSRKTHCALAGVSVPTFKALGHLARLPLLQPAYRGETGFTPIETIALSIAAEMVDQLTIAWERAAAISSRAELLLTYWDDLKETAAERRVAGKRDILFGRAMVPDKSDTRILSLPIVGTHAEIAAEHDRAILIQAISVTRVAGIIRNRALRLKIDLSEFWAEPVALPSNEQNSSRIGQPRPRTTNKGRSHPKSPPTRGQR